MIKGGNEMGHTKEEILEALNIIKEVCADTIDCANCAFYNVKCERCNFKINPPSCFKIVSESEIWRAFQE